MDILRGPLVERSGGDFINTDSDNTTQKFLCNGRLHVASITSDKRPLIISAGSGSVTRVFPAVNTPLPYFEDAVKMYRNAVRSSIAKSIEVSHTHINDIICLFMKKAHISILQRASP